MPNFIVIHETMSYAHILKTSTATPMHAITEKHREFPTHTYAVNTPGAAFNICGYATITGLGANRTEQGL